MNVRELFRNLKKEAECPLCLETVTDPKTLPCLHSFCLLCLDKHALYARRQLQTTIRCPVCLTCFQIPEGDTFGRLPTSFHLNRLVDVLALGDDNLQSQPCSSCEENNTATCYCFDCSDFFCDVCAKFHSKMKISRHHRSVLIQNLKTQDVEELLHRPATCSEKYHEKEALEYYCKECKVCICHKCVILNHNRHSIGDIREAAEEQKMQITKVVEQAKTKITHFELQIARETELFNKSREDTQAARDKVRTTIDELIRTFKEHEVAMVAKLDEVDEERQRCHTIQQEGVQFLATQLKSSVEYCEAVLQRNLSFEILQTQQTLIQRCEILLNKEVNVKKPMDVNYVTNEQGVDDLRQAVPGQVVVSWTDSFQSAAEGKGLEEAEVGREAKFTIITKDSEGKQCYNENDQLAITIRISSEDELVETVIQDSKDGKYNVAYTLYCAYYECTVKITLNDQPLTGSPWCIRVSPHRYKPAFKFGSFGWAVHVACCNVNDTIAVADSNNYRVQLFSSSGTFIEQFVFKSYQGKPFSVAFTTSGEIMVAHARQISLFTERLKFIKHVTNVHVKNPGHLSISLDGQMILTDLDDKSIKVLSADGTEMLLSFSATDCNDTSWSRPSSAVYHQGLYFVSFGWDHHIKVFNKEGQFLYDIGREGSGDGQLSFPAGLAIDNFNNLIVSDKGQPKVFSLDGKFVNIFEGSFRESYSIAVSSRGYVLASNKFRGGHVEVLD